MANFSWNFIRAYGLPASNFSECKLKINQSGKRACVDHKSRLVFFLQSINPVSTQLLKRLALATFHVSKKFYPLISCFFWGSAAFSL